MSDAVVRVAIEPTPPTPSYLPSVAGARELSPQNLAYISPKSRLFLAFISPISPSQEREWTRRAVRAAEAHGVA